MVAGLRRSQSKYPLNTRHFGRTWKDRSDARKCRRLIILIAGAVGVLPPLLRLPLFALALQTRRRLHQIEGWVDAPNPRFINRHRSPATFTDSALYDMRITKRANIQLLINGIFQHPTRNPIVRIECENGTVEALDVAFMMFLYWVSFPRKLSTMQKVFGREYSQISRVLKAMWVYIDTTWGHLVTNNLDYFVPRFPEYNRAFRAKYQALHGHPCSPRFNDTALLTDGHKVAINRDLRINFSGHKWMYCLSFLITSAMDGMIVEAFGATAGSHNDHHQQNASQIGTRLLNAQAGRPNLYKTGTDKGMHPQVCVVPMYNNPVNTPAQDLVNTEFSALRGTNEWDVGRPQSMFKYIDYRKVLFKHLQPIGMFFRISCIMTNLFNICDHNQTSEFYRCVPPATLRSYLV